MAASSRRKRLQTRRTNNMTALTRSRASQAEATSLNTMAAKAQNAALASVAEHAVQQEGKLKRLYTTALDKNSRVHKAGVDLGGSIAGVLSFEGLNLMIRYLGDKWPAMGQSIDYWQSLPHLCIGIVAYWGELLTRKKIGKDGAPAWPSMTREIFSEWSKVFILLGASNLIRALRVRRQEGKTAAARLAEAEAEVARLNQQLADLKKK